MRSTALVSLLVLVLLASAPGGANDGSPPTPTRKPLISDAAQIYVPVNSIPIPGHKPDFSQPDVTALLSFGQPPVPARKPLKSLKAQLHADDALTYRKIFAYQARGDFDKADQLMTDLADLRLRGHVLYQRYMHPASSKTSFESLAAWLHAYADHPGADRIYALAKKRMPGDFDGTLRAPVKGGTVSGYLKELSEHGRTYQSQRKASAQEIAKIEALKKSVRKALADGGAQRAHRIVQENPAHRLFDAVELDMLGADIARAYLTAGDVANAYKLAATASERSGAQVPLAGWVAGLAAWQQKKYALSARHFERTATSPYASVWTAAAGSFWASRAHLRAGNSREVSYWLQQAASHPRTFYGLIATRALGWDFDFNWEMPAYTQEHKNLLQRYPAAQRAVLLARAGQFHLAEVELRQIDPNQEKGLTEALMAFAHHAALPSYAMRLAYSTTAPGGRFYDAALYPLSPWTPQSGFKVDRALLYALIRQESRFNPDAQSPSGATGLMQLMPATASFVAGKPEYRTAGGRHSLKEPQVNLDLGQRYVESLMTQPAIESELFSLLIAYNAGPGNLEKWKQSYKHFRDDPLLFIEMIPPAETRAFVERVMANYWIYRLRMSQPAPSLDAVAAGRWAPYIALEKDGALAGITLPPYDIAAK